MYARTLINFEDQREVLIQNFNKLCAWKYYSIFFFQIAVFSLSERKVRERLHWRTLTISILYLSYPNFSNENFIEKCSYFSAICVVCIIKSILTINSCSVLLSTFFKLSFYCDFKGVNKILNNNYSIFWIFCISSDFINY